jgi:hypothetical protein
MRYGLVVEALMRWLAISSLLVASGCGGHGSESDMGRVVPDGFLQTMCMDSSDCDDGDNCTTDSCSAIQGCLHAPLNCSGVGDSCNIGTCNAHMTGCDGTAAKCCSAMPANDNMPCTTNGGLAGTCTSGTCIALPTCQIDPSVFLDCSSFNAVTNGLTLGPSAITDYTCVTGENGAEHAYQFQIFSDRQVTATLSNTVVPLDLIVLDGTQCVMSAACETHAQGTPTTAASVKWNAHANQNYLIVVDGQNANSGNFTLNLDCATCKPIQTLACNMSVMGNSTGAMATTAIASYPCATSEAGPEDSYLLAPSVATDYKVKLTGLSTDLDLIVIDSFSGQCDNSFCEASSVTSGTADETLAFHGYAGQNYDIVVDSKTTGGPYMLEVDCPPSCVGATSIDCFSLSDTRRNDDPSLSRNVVSSWGTCDTNTTGPEVVYEFFPPSTGMYTFTLTGLTADLDLIVESGTFSTCDPTNPCVASSVTPGTADETVTFLGDPTKVYYIAVDGQNGATSPYTLKLRSTQCPGPSCYNGANTMSCSYLEDTRRNDDTNRSTNRIDMWACDNNTTGPEVVYPFTPPANGMYTVTLDGMTANLDLIVVENTSAFTCDSASACVGSSTNTGTTNESVTFTGDTSHTFYVAVDGVAGATSPYHVKLASASCPPPKCTDGFYSMSCSSLVLSNRNDTSGSTSSVTSWGPTASPCDTGLTGPEFAHFFSPTGPGPYTVTMNGLAANLDLIVLETSSESSCDFTSACIGVGNNPGTMDEHVTFTANPGKFYWFIVDGVAGATSRYFLEVTAGCP